MKPGTKADPVNGELGTSPQQAWQKRKRSQGLCANCGTGRLEPTHSRCPACLEKAYESNFKSIARRLGKQKAAALLKEAFQ